MRIRHSTAVTIAEVAFLLIMFSGVWSFASEIPAFGISEERKFVADAALAIAGLLLIFATYAGKLLG